MSEIDQLRRRFERASRTGEPVLLTDEDVAVGGWSHTTAVPISESREWTREFRQAADGHMWFGTGTVYTCRPDGHDEDCTLVPYLDVLVNRFSNVEVQRAEPLGGGLEGWLRTLAEHANRGGGVVLEGPRERCCRSTEAEMPSDIVEDTHGVVDAAYIGVRRERSRWQIDEYFDNASRLELALGLAQGGEPPSRAQ